jgi:hypothetical protein
VREEDVEGGEKEKGRDEWWNGAGGEGERRKIEMGRGREREGKRER